MKRKTGTMVILLFSALILLIPVSGLYAEVDNAIVEAFQRNFARGNLSTKIQVLQDAAEMDNGRMEPLYLQALDFILSNVRTLRGDNTARELTILAVRLVGMHSYSEAAPMLWTLFEQVTDTHVRVAVLNSMGSVAQGQPDMIRKINMWLSSQNNRIRTGQRTDNQVVSESIAALGRLGDESSFPILFSASVIGYGDEITYKAVQAMERMNGSHGDLLLKVLSVNPPEEKTAVLDRAMNHEGLTHAEKGVIAQKALELGLFGKHSDSRELLKMRELRFKAVRGLIELKWSDATRLAIQHLDMTLEEFESGMAGVSEVLDALDCLGAMASHEAAVRLTQYLEVLNTSVESGQPVQERIVLGVINNLRLLGDRVAFDHLLYSGYLDYPSSVKRAAREAIDNLKPR